MRVVEAGEDGDAGRGRVQVDEARVRSGEALDLAVGAGGEDMTIPDGHGGDGLGMVFREAGARVDDAVEEDQVWRGCLGAGERCECEHSGQQSGKDAHGRSLAGACRRGGRTCRKNICVWPWGALGRA